jgi:hypothetical protein
MKKLASLLPDRLKLHLLRRHLAGSLRTPGGDAPAVALDHRPGGGDALQVRLYRDPGDDRYIGIAMDLAAALDRPAVYRMLYARLPVAMRVFWHAGSELRDAGADLSDGYAPIEGGLSFCSSRSDVVLIPDPVFFNSGGYAEFRDARLALPWTRRSDTVLWRGTSTGAGLVTTETMQPSDPQLRARVRMCLRLAGVPGTDARIRKTEGDAAPADHERLVRHGLLGSRIAQARFGRYKFALDVDGHTNAWSNFMVRLLLGCCVLKIESERGYRQWFYDRLQPWSHFVPVRADMSDLLEKISWCRSHDSDCQRIAAAAFDAAHRMTVAGEIDDAACRLQAAARARPQARSA